MLTPGIVRVTETGVIATRWTLCWVSHPVRLSAHNNHEKQPYSSQGTTQRLRLMKAVVVSLNCRNRIRIQMCLTSKTFDPFAEQLSFSNLQLNLLLLLFSLVHHVLVVLLCMGGDVHLCIPVCISNLATFSSLIIEITRTFCLVSVFEWILVCLFFSQESCFLLNKCTI